MNQEQFTRPKRERWEMKCGATNGTSGMSCRASFVLRRGATYFPSFSGLSTVFACSSAFGFWISGCVYDGMTFY